MKPTPLLEMWQPPEGSGEAVGILATTFALEPDFFERACLTRALGVESVDEGTGSAEDIVARLELEERLQTPTVVVLADRSAPVERGTLRWDLLQCRVPNGLLHSKIVVLLWERATRVVIGSANLTSAGYRHNIEVAVPVDLGAACLLPPTVLQELADELDSYLDLVPGLHRTVPARERVEGLLGLFRERIASSGPLSSAVTVALAPTSPETSPLDRLGDVWRGSRPLAATHVSPFWDTQDPVVLTRVKDLLTGRPAAERSHRVAVSIGPTGAIDFPATHIRAGHVERPVLLKVDDHARTLHAKCLILEGRDWIAALVGSSNHTRSGLGLGGARRHREINVWLGASTHSAEGRALAGFIVCGDHVDADLPDGEPFDEDEPEELHPLPDFFLLCRLMGSSGEGWSLDMTFAPPCPLEGWRILLADGTAVIDQQTWGAAGGPRAHRVSVDEGNLPLFVDVEWSAGTASWPVLADTRHTLPPAPPVADLRAHQLLDALSRGITLAQLQRELLAQKVLVHGVGGVAIETDPLKRFDSQQSLLRWGRALASALTAMERRLSQPVSTTDMLEARLRGPLGPANIATRVVADCQAGSLTVAKAIFTIAEIILSVARVPWSETVKAVNQDVAMKLVRCTLDSLDQLRRDLGAEPADLAEYGQRAFRQASRCLS